MEGMIMTTQLLLSLSILIAVHEWGHFITARMFNIKVEKFYLFFDFLFPMANVLNFSLFKYKKGDTEYGIGWFPLGGYVKIAGMVDESMDKEQLKAPPQPWEFRAKPAWQRLIVMLGGIIVNVIVGVIIFVGLTYVLGDTYIPKNFVNENGGIHSMELGEQLGFKTGDKIIKINGKDFDDFLDVTKPDVLLSPNSYYTVMRDGQEINLSIPGNFIENFNSKEAQLNFVMPRIPAKVGLITEVVELPNEVKIASVASRAGLKEGDQFIEVDGQAVFYHDEVVKLIKSGLRDSIAFKIKRGEEELSFKEDFKGQTQVGFFPKNIDRSNLAFIDYSFGESISLGTERAFGVIFIQLKAFKKIFTGEMSLRRSLSGPIGMAQAFGTEWDWERFWRMTGLLSMVLAFMNLLPIPALDGGYVMFLLYEMISGREPSEKFFETALKIGMAMLLVLMVFVFYNDIAKLFTNG
jgi:regulator of sigma E protease